MPAKRAFAVAQRQRGLLPPSVRAILRLGFRHELRG